MPIIIKCKQCGFIFYNDNRLTSIQDVLKNYGYRCPVCMSLIPSSIREIVHELEINVKPVEGINYMYERAKSRIASIVRLASRPWKCYACEREIQPHEIYAYSDKPLCLECYVKTLSNIELRALNEVLKEKYNTTLEEQLKKIKQF